MLTKTLPKIDRFYFLMVATLVLLTGLVIYAASQIFLALITANSIDEAQVGQVPRINNVSLDQAWEIVSGKDKLPLDELK